MTDYQPKSDFLRTLFARGFVHQCSDVEGLGRGDRLVARVQMAGPGDYLVRGVEPALAPEPTDAADPDPAEAPPAKRPTRKRPRSTRESPLSDDR